MKRTLKSLGLSLVAVIVAGTAISCSTRTQTLDQYQNDLIQSQSADQGFLASKTFTETGNTIIKVFYTDKRQITTLNELGMDVWWVQPGFVIGQVPQDLLERVKRTNLRVDMLSPQEGFSVKNSFDSAYHTYDEMVSELNSIVGKYPTLAKLHDIGDSWEKTKGIANRDIWMLQITGKGDGSKKPGIVFFGNHHARELVTVEIPMLLINHLLSNYGKDADITNMIDNTEIWIAPMVNPDGHTLAEKGDNWRKNKNTNKDISANARMGVDLNRNYGHQWNTGGSSNDTGSETYHGKAPFSEPETQATRDFMKAHANLKVMMSYHSFSNLILWPWGWSNGPSPDAAKFETIGKKLGANTGYKPEQASDLYIASGITDDWSYATLKMISFTTEIGSWNDGFDPPYSRVQQFWKENLPNALYLIKLAGEQNVAGGNNPNAAFGPDIASVTKTSVNNLSVSFNDKYENNAVKAEYFVGKAGKPGTGIPVSMEKSGQLSFSVKAGATDKTVYVRAQGANGKWGPVTAAFIK
jgi:carboxypeptidase T